MDNAYSHPCPIIPDYPSGNVDCYISISNYTTPSCKTHPLHILHPCRILLIFCLFLPVFSHTPLFRRKKRMVYNLMFHAPLRCLINLFSFLYAFLNRLQIYHSNYLVLHILNSFYPNSAYIFSCHFKIYIGKQSFTKTICFGRCPH